jgi:hypothetical protein
MTRRRRALLAVVLIASLLFHPVARAAFACAQAKAPPPMPPGMEHCKQMAMAPAHADAPALCAKHCAPDQTLTADHAAPTVPMLALPPAFPLVLGESVALVARQGDVPVARSDPPPRLRYCSLQI